jgi:hypothetical protein
MEYTIQEIGGSNELQPTKSTRQHRTHDRPEVVRNLVPELGAGRQRRNPTLECGPRPTTRTSFQNFMIGEFYGDFVPISLNASTSLGSRDIDYCTRKDNSLLF